LNGGKTQVQRVFVKVIGFSDVERHALNTLFRLSEVRDISYALWQPAVGKAAALALIDSNSYEARLEFEAPSNAKLKMIWVGPGAPRAAWRSFDRPLQWPDVIAAMDHLFQPALDLDFADGPDALDTQPPEPSELPRRVLIASPDRDARLYLRARLSLADLTQADEAETSADALELVRGTRYDLAFVDFSLPGAAAGWDLIRQLASAEPRIPHLIVTKDKVSPGDRMRAWQTGTQTFLTRPPDPEKLKSLLDRF
jgi:CheY-like chemotaxis protein